MIKHELENIGLEDFSIHPVNLLRFSKVHFLFRLFGGGGGNDQNSDEQENNDGYWWSPRATCMGEGITITDGCGLGLPQSGYESLMEPAVRANGPANAVEKIKREYGDEQCKVCKKRFRDCVLDAVNRSIR